MGSILLPETSMGLPVKISDELALRARGEAEASERSLTAQIEHWALLGAALEEVLGHRQALALKKAGHALSLQEALAHADSVEGQEAALRHVLARTDVRYEMDPADPKRLLRVSADGSRQAGRFVNRIFVPDPK